MRLSIPGVVLGFFVGRQVCICGRSGADVTRGSYCFDSKQGRAVRSASLHTIEFVAYMWAGGVVTGSTHAGSAALHAWCVRMRSDHCCIRPWLHSGTMLAGSACMLAVNKDFGHVYCCIECSSAVVGMGCTALLSVAAPFMLAGQVC